MLSSGSATVSPRAECSRRACSEKSIVVLAYVASFGSLPVPAPPSTACAFTEYSFFSNDPSAFLYSVTMKINLDDDDDETDPDPDPDADAAPPHVATPSATSLALDCCTFAPRVWTTTGLLERGAEGRRRA